MSSRRTAAVAAAALLALAALGAASGAPGQVASGLFGVVERGPVTPVCMVDVPCDVPARGVTLVFSRDGRYAARSVTGQDGSYRVRLGPGTYSVRTLPASGRPLQPARARVVAGRLRRLDFSIDTGIR